MKSQKHKWIFISRFRANTYGWKASKLACKRIKEAVSEIKKVARKNPLLGAEGSIRFMEKIWPSLQGVDSSSGALGTAVSNAMDILLDIIIFAPTSTEMRAKWLDRLWEAYEDDGVGFLDELGDRWGEVCSSKEIASKWADEFLPGVKQNWDETQEGSYSYIRREIACLSCLLAAERYEEIMDLLEQAPYIAWSYRKYGVRALAEMGGIDQALEYAEESCGLNDNQSAIDRYCEDILLDFGAYEEAYDKYAFTSNQGTMGLATFRNIVKKYPMKDKQEILKDLIASTPRDEGRWFATAKTIGMLDLAIDLANRSPCEPKTLNRAARDYLNSNPEFALGVAMASIKWLCDGWGYEITNLDVHAAYRYAMQAAQLIGMEDKIKQEIREIVGNDRSVGLFVYDTLKSSLGKG